MGRQQDGGGDGLQQQQQRAQRPVSVSVAAAVGRQQQQRGTRLWMAPITNARANFVGEVRGTFCWGLGGVDWFRECV